MSNLFKSPSVLLRAVEWCEDGDHRAPNYSCRETHRRLENRYPTMYAYPIDSGSLQHYETMRHCKYVQQPRNAYTSSVPGGMMKSLIQLASVELLNINREEKMLFGAYSDNHLLRHKKYKISEDTIPTHPVYNHNEVTPSTGIRNVPVYHYGDVETTSSASTDCSNRFRCEADSILPHMSARYSHVYNRNGYVGIYSPEARASVIARFKAKRERRVWNKKIRYNCRKNLADSRLRMKGRFVKMSDDQKATLRKMNESSTKSDASTSGNSESSP